MNLRPRVRVNQNEDEDNFIIVFRIFLSVRGKYGTKEDSVTISVTEK